MNFKKIRIFQADDNDKVPEVNKFKNVIEVLLPLLGNSEDFNELIKGYIANYNYVAALEAIRKVVDFQISAKDITLTNDNFEEVKNILKVEDFDIYIIDLRWGNLGDVGHQLVELLKHRVPKERIAIYTNYDDALINSLRSSEDQYPHLWQNEFKNDFTFFFKKAIESLKREIILHPDDGEIDRIKKALHNNDHSIFNYSIKYKNSNYKFSDFYLGIANVNSMFIANNIKTFIYTNNINLKFPRRTSYLNESKIYVEEYILKKGTAKIYNYLDFCALNLFLLIHSKMSKENFLSLNYSINDFYLPNENPNPKRRDSSTTNEGWLKFYKILVSRRVLLLWSEYYDSFNKIIKNNCQENRYGNISRMLSTGNSSIKRDEGRKLISDFLSGKLGLTKKDDTIIYEGEHSFQDEKRFLDSYSNEKLNSIIDFISKFNAKIGPDFGVYGEKFDYWDIKKICKNKNTINDEDLYADFLETINNKIDVCLDFDSDFKEIFFNKDISDFNSLLLSISK